MNFIATPRDRFTAEKEPKFSLARYVEMEVIMEIPLGKIVLGDVHGHLGFSFKF